MRLAAIALMMLGCRGEPPICERYLRHADELAQVARTTPYNEAELAYCNSHTPEQLQCAIAAPTVDELMLCEQFKDAKQRALGRTLTANIKPAWPGRAELKAVLTGTRGCAFSGVIGRQDLVSDRQAVVAFALRDANTTGDAPTILATLVLDGTEWRCVSTDPADKCELLAQQCR